MEDQRNSSSAKSEKDAKDTRSSMIGNNTDSNDKTVVSPNNTSSVDDQSNSRDAKSRVSNANTKSRSSSNIQKHKATLLGDESPAEDNDDLGWWDCTLCTYRNSNAKSKCEICDLKRVGTSTRKPRGNSAPLIMQVVKQQEQIKQQTTVKPAKPMRTPNGPGSQTGGVASSSSESAPKQKAKSPGKAFRHPQSEHSGHESSDDDERESDSSRSSAKPKRKRSGSSRPSKRKASNDRNRGDAGEFNENDEESDDARGHNSDNESDLTIVSGESSSSKPRRSPSVSSLDSSHESASSPEPEPSPSSPVHSSTAASDAKSDNPFRITPLEVSGNLIKYSPPTKSGRTGLIIDKKRFTQHSVTVNEVTITFTEFATRQNNYIRKKKRRRDGSRIRNGGSNNKNKDSRSASKKVTDSNGNEDQKEAQNEFVEDSVQD